MNYMDLVVLWTVWTMARSLLLISQLAVDVITVRNLVNLSLAAKEYDVGM